MHPRAAAPVHQPAPSTVMALQMTDKWRVGHQSPGGVSPGTVHISPLCIDRELQTHRALEFQGRGTVQSTELSSADKPGHSSIGHCAAAARPRQRHPKSPERSRGSGVLGDRGRLGNPIWGRTVLRPGHPVLDPSLLPATLGSAPRSLPIAPRTVELFVKPSRNTEESTKV